MGTVSQLECLADELLLCIIEQLDSHQDLCNLAATSPKLQDITEPYVWRSLLVRKGEHAATLARAVQNKPSRMSAIHDLAVRYDEDNQRGIEHLNAIIPQLLKLRHLTIESPCPNNHNLWKPKKGMRYWACTGINYAQLFEESIKSDLRPPPLAMLQSVTLHGHLNSRDPFVFGRSAAIFLHPTLRNLAISCANLDESDFEHFDIPESKLKSTPLQSLTFIECNIYLSFLRIALSLPKALKELSVNERLHHCSRSTEMPQTRDPMFLDVLNLQASSLERFVHRPGHIWAQSQSPNVYVNVATKFRSFPALKHLEVDVFPNVAYRQGPYGFPDSLQMLKLTDHGYGLIYNAAMAQRLNRFSKLFAFTLFHVVEQSDRPVNVDICFTAGDTSFGATNEPAEWWGNKSEVHKRNRTIIYQIACVLKSRGARFRVFREYFPGGVPYIPPYMYGEETPVEVLEYDSEDLFRFSGRDFRDEDYGHLLGRPNLIAKCAECRKGGATCVNRGYGTNCTACEKLGKQCEYPPPSSPWSVN